MARTSRSGSRGGNADSAPRFSRDMLLLFVMCALFAVVISQLVRLQVIKADEYREAVDAAHTTEQTISAKRGTIYDRNGEVLASSVEVKTIYTDPTMVEDPDAVAKVLVEVLGDEYEESYSDYHKLLTKDTQYAVIQSKVDSDLADELAARLAEEGLAGIYYADDTRRVYPYGDVGSQIVGNVTVNDDADSEDYGRVEGNSGLELGYDDLLGGTDGKAQVIEGRTGIPLIGGTFTETEAVDGEDIVTSVDIKLQEKAETSLLDAIEEYRAAGGNAMVVDASTGEIYAACSYAAEEEDGDDEGSESSDTTYSLEVGKLASITDAYEPGSTFKTITAASILENSEVTASSTFTVPGSLEVYDATITDSHDHDTQDMTFEQILAQSSNVGMVLVSRKVDSSNLYDTYTTCGFGSKFDIDFPGVASGTVESSDDWDPVRAANVTFGQGLTVTNAQLLSAYGAIEQGGTAYTPHFLTSVSSNDEVSEEMTAELTEGTEVLEAGTCETLTDMLEAVVTDGTGTDAAIEGYTVVGKTGTAQIAEGGSYSDDYNVSFIGWLENTSCDLVCIVTINEPDTDAGGGPVCGPVFADIMSFAIERYQVVSDAD